MTVTQWSELKQELQEKISEAGLVMYSTTKYFTKGKQEITDVLYQGLSYSNLIDAILAFNYNKGTECCVCTYDSTINGIPSTVTETLLGITGGRFRIRRCEDWEETIDKTGLWCHYNLNLIEHILSFPVTIVNYSKNNQVISVYQTFNNENDFTDYMVNQLGWTFGATLTYDIYAPDSYDYITISGNIYNNEPIVLINHSNCQFTSLPYTQKNHVCKIIYKEVCSESLCGLDSCSLDEIYSQIKNYINNPIQ